MNEIKIYNVDISNLKEISRTEKEDIVIDATISNLASAEALLMQRLTQRLEQDRFDNNELINVAKWISTEKQTIMRSLKQDSATNQFNVQNNYCPQEPLQRPNLTEQELIEIQEELGFNIDK